MPIFEYQARDSMGISVSGRLEADSPKDLQDRLRAFDLMLENASEKGRRPPRLTRRIPTKQLIHLLRDLATLDESGVPILSGLSDLRQGETRRSCRRVLEAMYQCVERGQTLAEAMESMPGAFPDQVIATTRAGERSGQLARVLGDLGQHLEWRQSVRSQTRQVMIYPAVLGMAMTGLALIILCFLIPRLEKMMTTLDAALPLPTRIVLGLSQSLQAHGLVWLSALAVLIIVLGLIRLSRDGRIAMDHTLLRLPVLGPVLRQIGSGQICSTLTTLLGAGLPLPESLRLTARVVPNHYLANVVQTATAAVMHGQPLSEAMGRHQVFPPLVQRMIQLGESTGTLEESLQRVVRQYDREVPALVKRLVSFLEPMTILCGGAAVGFILFAAFLPLLELIQAVQM